MLNRQKGFAYFAVAIGVLWLLPAFATQDVAWMSNLSVTNVPTGDYVSSTQLLVSWEAPSVTIDHYQITATDYLTQIPVKFDAANSQTSATLTGLKAGTEYDIRMQACVDAACSQTLASDVIGSGMTSEEYWQLVGTGNRYEDVIHVTDDSSTLAYVIRHGTESPVAGQFQLFYNATDRSQWGHGTQVGINDGSGDVNALSHYTPTASILRPVCDTKPNQPIDCPVGSLNTFAFQAVPLRTPDERIRLYFEAHDLGDPQQTTRIYYLDSRDGFIGQDFNPNPDATTCGGLGSADYNVGGDCEPTLVIDAGAGNLLANARQFKIGYPWNVSWIWDMQVGTFMVITGADNCGVTNNGLFFTQWDGGQWVVNQQNNCAKPLVEQAHGPVIVPLNDNRYKLYYEALPPSGVINDGKPLHLIYAEPTLTENPQLVEFDDWESPTQAREVHFLWPDGTLLNPFEEAGLGDHMILMPTDDPSYQVMYVNLGGFDNPEWSKPSAGLGMAVLVNP